MVAGKLLVLAGLALLLFTGYQATSYRELLRLTQLEFEGLPLTLLAQLGAAVAACVLGGLQVSGSFVPIRLGDTPKPEIMRPHRTDFAVFNHRGTLLASLPHMSQLNDLGREGSGRLQIG
ncbi:membrane magnesium transporter [Micractinium conductrix]|uniref:Membrane magnesium transporter n=1 Tax=Micractinium conductrix TaxID=554055 RepID=A0A2P6VR39_9CHLO|nr:membrane magnesium transporter [Micractinium conductrix]|eukprot:PSC76541.1 membrane magnesium transporter [Micractinium conductrix]